MARERNLDGFEFFTKNVPLCPGGWAKPTTLPDQRGTEESMAMPSQPPKQTRGAAP